MSDRALLFVDSNAALAEARALLAGAAEIGLDAEMNGLHAYRARVCVLQIATEDLDVIIDTVAVKDLAPIAPMISGATTVCYLHGAAHDVKCMKQDFGLGIGALFDTYVAAQLLGVEKLGYGDVVNAHFGATLDKALQTHDWGRRPLTPEQIAYLRNDVRWLNPLGRKLRDELVAKDLLEEAQGEFARVAALPAEEISMAEDAWAKNREARELPSASQAALREMFLVRDAIARRLDRPPFKVVGDPVLLEIAKRRPADLAEAAKISGVPRDPRRLEEFLEAARRGFSAGVAPPLPKPPRIEPEEIRARRVREEALRGWRKRTAAARSVPGMAVLPSYALDDLARLPPASLEDLATRPGMIPKRVRMYGAELISLIGPT